VLGKHSGRHAFRQRVRDLGFALDEFETNRAFQEFKKLADRKKDLYDGDIEAIVMNVDSAAAGPWMLQSMEVVSGTEQAARARLRLLAEDGTARDEEATASGPIEAAFTALEQATGISLILQNFELHSATTGDDAQGEVTVTVEHEGQSYRGHGTSVDIVEAGTRACLEVMNRILRRRESGTAGAAAAGDNINRASI